MKAGELIEQLQALPPDTEICASILGSPFPAAIANVSALSNGKAWIVVNDSTERQARVEHTDRCVDSIQQAMRMLKDAMTEMQSKAGFF